MKKYLKRFLKVHLLLISSIAFFLAILAAKYIWEFSYEIFYTLIVALATFYLGALKIQMENDRFFKELFAEFNGRYDALNKDLFRITENVNSVSELDFEDKNTVNDYFNLCAEEYYWYKKNRINKKVWRSWKRGMDFWYSSPLIQEYWELEAENKESYYLEPKEDFFKN